MDTFKVGEIVHVAGEGEHLVIAGPSRDGVYALRRVYYRAEGEIGLANLNFQRAGLFILRLGMSPVPAEDRAFWAPLFEQR